MLPTRIIQVPCLLHQETTRASTALWPARRCTLRRLKQQIGGCSSWLLLCHSSAEGLVVAVRLNAKLAFVLRQDPQLANCAAVAFPGVPPRQARRDESCTSRVRCSADEHLQAAGQQRRSSTATCAQ